MYDSRPEQVAPLTRRSFLRQGTLLLSATALNSAEAFPLLADDAPAEPMVRCGLMTDLHYADRDPGGTRHYRETLDKLEAAAAEFVTSELDFLVELGDFIDAAPDVETELSYLGTINARFSRINADRHYVLGNHCVDTLTKPEFLAAVGRERSYYAFDRGGVHFIVLDACFRSDGTPYGRRNFQWTDPNIPPEELDWLKQDLAATRLPTIVFAHQRLDVENQYGIRNAAAVRRVFQEAGDVLAVFQGHSHRNDHQELDGIHYVTLVAMVEGSGRENNGFAKLTVGGDRTLRVDGFVKQAAYRFPPAVVSS